jgi:hypothetical protein
MLATTHESWSSMWFGTWREGARRGPHGRARRLSRAARPFREEITARLRPASRTAALGGQALAWPQLRRVRHATGDRAVVPALLDEIITAADIGERA